MSLSLGGFQREHETQGLDRTDINPTTAPEERKYEDSYFIPEQGVYRKKMNIVGDQAQWTCYRLHVYTRHREVGVMGVRRRFLPPLLDTYQDMVFVLYGKFSTQNLEVDPTFMRTLEATVSTISLIRSLIHFSPGGPDRSLSSLRLTRCHPPPPRCKLA